MLDRARWATTKSFVPGIRALGDGRATAVEGTASGRGTIVVGFILTPEGHAAVDAAVTETARRPTGRRALRPWRQPHRLGHGGEVPRGVRPAGGAAAHRGHRARHA